MARCPRTTSTVIDDPAAAEASLDPIRARLFAELAELGSASTLAARVGLTRQRTTTYDESAASGRPHRFVVALHPTPTHDKETQP